MKEFSEGIKNSPKSNETNPGLPCRFEESIISEYEDWRLSCNTC